MSDAPPQTLNVPSLLLFLALTFLAVRYFFFSPSSSNRPQRGAGRSVDPAAIEQISQMFPQADPRAITWDLQRNGGSVQATTERLLVGGRLEVPPPSFQPVLPPPPSSIASASTAASSSESKSMHPDLITRYNLASRIGEEGKAEEMKPAWSNNKSERQALLQRRREEMVLKARRKMEEREGRAG